MLNNSFSNLGEASRLISPEAQWHYVEMCLSQYEAALKSNSSAMDYVYRQRRLSKCVCERFKVGFCDRTLGKMLPDSESFEGAMIRGALQRFGLIKPNGRELFRGSITIPIYDEHNQLIDVYGRKISNNQRKDVNLRLSIHGKAVSFFNAYALQDHKEVILCSTPVEALSLISCGVENVISAVGIDTLTNVLAEQLAQNEVRQVMFAMANTVSAQRYKHLFVRSLRQLGIDYDDIELPVGEDINSVLVKSEFLSEICRQLNISIPRSLVCH